MKNFPDTAADVSDGDSCHLQAGDVDGHIAATFPIFVRLFSSTTCLVVHGSDPISALKLKLQSKTGIPVKALRLSYRGKPLDNYDTAVDCGLKSLSTVWLNSRLKGGMQPVGGDGGADKQELFSEFLKLQKQENEFKTIIKERLEWWDCHTKSPTKFWTLEMLTKEMPREMMFYQVCLEKLEDDSAAFAPKLAGSYPFCVSTPDDLDAVNLLIKQGHWDGNELVAPMALPDQEKEVLIHKAAEFGVTILFIA